MIKASWTLRSSFDGAVWLGPLVVAVLLGGAQMGWILGAVDVVDAYRACDAAITASSAEAWVSFRSCVAAPNASIALSILRTIAVFLSIGVGFYQAQVLWHVVRHRRHPL
jgi:hypothetical protein